MEYVRDVVNPMMIAPVKGRNRKSVTEIEKEALKA
jgi:hypothetical protein